MKVYIISANNKGKKTIIETPKVKGIKNPVKMTDINNINQKKGNIINKHPQFTYSRVSETIPIKIIPTPG